MIPPVVGARHACYKLRLDPPVRVSYRAAIQPAGIAPVRILFSVLSLLVLSACIHTQEMPLAPNVVRIDTQASGLLFVGQASSSTIRRAAELTLKNGYSHFRLDQAQVSQGSVITGVYSTSTGYATGTRYGGVSYLKGTSYGSSFVGRAPTANVGVTVIMFHANEPGAEGTFSAAEVLTRKDS